MPLPNVWPFKKRLAVANADKPARKAGAEASTLTCVASGLVCGVQVFVFSAVFSEMIFGQNPILQGAVPLGVGMNTMSTLIASLVFVRLSGCRAVMAAPDINPIVFLAEAASKISANLCPDSWDGCEQADRAVPTVLASTFIATLLVGLSFWLLGRLRLSVIVGFIPCSPARTARRRTDRCASLSRVRTHHRRGVHHVHRHDQVQDAGAGPLRSRLTYYLGGTH